MFKLQGYQLISTIYESSQTITYKVYRETEQALAIAKLLKSEYPTIEEIARLRNEYKILKSVNLTGVIKPVGFESYQNRWALVLNHFSGESIKHQLSGWKRIEIKSFLKIAINLTRILSQLHQQRIIHKDLKPHHILLNPTNWAVEIVDFSIATRLERENPLPGNPYLLEGTLAYMSPEQTGRMNRAIDYRTDFYSLGVTFYEMLAGRLPFETPDAMELVHCHIAKEPTPLSQLVPDLPETVSAIVMKLLAKTAEERYQSASGITTDLEECLFQLERFGKVAEFVPGQLDTLSQFTIPQKLYGRSEEVKQLLQSFERVARGSSEMMLAIGYSGIGKTAVINEVHKPIVKARGYFISGKFDQFQREIPYAAIGNAFSELIEQLLTENPEKIGIWKETIITALGENGKVVVDVIPNLELIIGVQPPVAEVEPTESQNRFYRTFKKFLNIFTTQDHPLVLFLDDLQWADNASLKLIQQMMTDLENQYLFLIGAYRDNEVSPTHPTLLAVEAIEKMGAVVNRIVLSPLNQQDVAELVADTLNERERSQELAELLFNKTQGNPFFLTQLFKTLYHENLLSFNFTTRAWAWDIAQIKAQRMTDYNVVELVATNIRKFSPSTQEILKIAACLGNKFSLEVLAAVTQKSVSIAAQDLWEALQTGLIIPLSNTYKIPLGIEWEEESALQDEDVRVSYRFLHDRIQQAAYSLIAESQRKATHLKIGRLLLQNTHQHLLAENIFDIVNQLNIGVDLITEESAKQELASLNLVAGQRAKAAAAYEAAVRYLTVGIQLLSENSWETDYALTLNLYLEALEAEYITANYDRSLFLSEKALSKVKETLDKAKIYQLRIPFYLQQNQPETALKIGLEVLSMLGVRLEEEIHLEQRAIAELADLPEMTDPYKRMAIKILMNLVPTTYMAAPSLYPKIVLKTIALSMENGNCPGSAHGYANYALLLCMTPTQIELGYQYGRLALHLVEKFKAKELRCKVAMTFNTYVRPWKEHIRATLSPLIEAGKDGLETGDTEFSCYSFSIYLAYLFAAGENLELVKEAIEKYLILILRYRLEWVAHQFWLWEQLILNLQGKSANPLQIIGERFNIDREVEVFKQSKNHTMLAYIYLANLQLLVIFNQYKEATKYGQLLESIQKNLAGNFNLALFNFYYSLALLGDGEAVSRSDRVGVDLQLDANQQALQIWINQAPMNFQHKYDLIEAEKARISRDYLLAMELYDRAIAGAKEQGFVHEEAIACERTAEFYLILGRQQIAKTYMTQAYYSYIQWGAIAKAEQLEERYPHLITRSTYADNNFLDLTQTNTLATTQQARILDLTTVLKASQILSGEIVLEKLLDKMMRIAIENAGAKLGFFLTKENNQWKIEAKATVAKNELKICYFPDLEIAEQVPISILNYTERTRDSLVLDDATKDKRFASDSYMVAKQNLSILCLPLIHSQKIAGIIYLENNLAAGAFTRWHLEVLKLISSQMAIFIDNARLYGDLQRRSLELEQKNRALEESEAREREKAQQLEDSLHRLQQTQAQLVHAERISTLGQLVAGVAHEVNNPIAFLAGNIRFAQEHFEELLKLVQVYQEEYPHPPSRVIKTLEEIELDYIVEDLPQMLEALKVGTDRIHEIMQSLRNFSRTDASEKKYSDLHSGLESTLMILQYRLKGKDGCLPIQVVKEYGSLPLVPCYLGQLNQVFMNLLANAIDALNGYGVSVPVKVKDRANPTIRIRTEVVGDRQVAIRIIDNGPGMTAEVVAQLFRPFFTTKPEGRGTGLGLSIGYQIVVEKHQGSIECLSAVGEGTEFVIKLPIF